MSDHAFNPFVKTISQITGSVQIDDSTPINATLVNVPLSIDKAVVAGTAITTGIGNSTANTERVVIASDDINLVAINTNTNAIDINTSAINLDTSEISAYTGDLAKTKQTRADYPNTIAIDKSRYLVNEHYSSPESPITCGISYARGWGVSGGTERILLIDSAEMYYKGKYLVWEVNADVNVVPTVGFGAQLETRFKCDNLSGSDYEFYVALRWENSDFVIHLVKQLIENQQIPSANFNIDILDGNGPTGINILQTNTKRAFRIILDSNGHVFFQIQAKGDYVTFHHLDINDIFTSKSEAVVFNKIGLIRYDCQAAGTTMYVDSFAYYVSDKPDIDILDEVKNQTETLDSIEVSNLNIQNSLANVEIDTGNIDLVQQQYAKIDGGTQDRAVMIAGLNAGNFEHLNSTNRNLHVDINAQTLPNIQVQSNTQNIASEATVASINTQMDPLIRANVLNRAPGLIDQYYMKGWSDNITTVREVLGVDNVNFVDIELPNADIQLQISSSISADISLSVLIIGYDANFNLINTVAVTDAVDAQNAVTIGTQFYRISRMQVLNGTNTGDIYLTDAASTLVAGVPSSALSYRYSIKQNENIGAILNGVIPPLANGYLMPNYVAYSVKTDIGSACNLYFQMKPTNSAVWNTEFVFYVNNADSNTQFSWPLNGLPPIANSDTVTPVGYDFRIQAVRVGNGVVHASGSLAINQSI